MDNNNQGFFSKNGGLIAGIVIVIIVIIIIAVAASKKPAATDTGATAGAPATTATAGDTTATTTAGATVSGSTAGDTAAMSYTDALRKYGNNRIQFDSNCAATPKNAIYKDGTAVMLDNRSGVDRSIHVGALGTFVIPATGYKVVTLTAASIPANILIDCGTQQNVANITVQK